MTDKILVIKLGALGDFVQALGPMQAIRDHHAGAHVSLLTTAPFIPLAKATGLFDGVIEHARMRWTQPGQVLDFRRRLRAGGYARVYDLQTSDRSSLYYRLFWPGPWPQWSGIAAGCSHPHANPQRDLMHTFERQAEQLAMAGVERVPAPDFSWAKPDDRPLPVDGPYALLVPGGAAHRPEKRWPAECYADAARWLKEKGLAPVFVGAASEAELVRNIVANAPGSLSLAGETSLLDLVALAQGAALALGNDTGPMHIAAVTGVPTIVFYSHASDPALCAQRGPRVTILREPSLDRLSLDVATKAITQALPTLDSDR